MNVTIILLQCWMGSTIDSGGKHTNIWFDLSCWALLPFAIFVLSYDQRNFTHCRYDNLMKDLQDVFLNASVGLKILRSYTITRTLLHRTVHRTRRNFHSLKHWVGGVESSLTSSRALVLFVCPSTHRPNFQLELNHAPQAQPALASLLTEISRSSLALTSVEGFWASMALGVRVCFVLHACPCFCLHLHVWLVDHLAVWDDGNWEFWEFKEKVVHRQLTYCRSS